MKVISFTILIVCCLISALSIIMLILMLVNKIKRNIRERNELKRYVKHITTSRHFEDDGAYADDDIE
jgi:hypothetical protein